MVGLDRTSCYGRLRTDREAQAGAVCTPFTRDHLAAILRRIFKLAGIDSLNMALPIVTSAVSPSSTSIARVGDDPRPRDTSCDRHATHRRPL